LYNFESNIVDLT